MSQTTAPQIEMDVGSDGLIAEGSSPMRVETGVNPSAAMLYGYLATYDYAAGRDVLQVPALSADVTADAAGIAVKRETKVSDPSVTPPQYAAKDSVPVLRQGKAWVRVEDAVTLGGACFVNFQNGAEGQFRSDNDGGNAAQLPSAVYRTSATAGELAIVELNLP